MNETDLKINHHILVSVMSNDPDATPELIAEAVLSLSSFREFEFGMRIARCKQRIQDRTSNVQAQRPQHD